MSYISLREITKREGYEEGYKQGRADAIDEFANKMKKYYWDSDIQSVKDDPCVIDAMIDLAIRTAKEVKESEQLKENQNV